MREIDLLIKPTWVLPVVPENTLLTDHVVAVHHGEIVDVCATEYAAKHYQASEVLTLENKLLMPGLINAHTHAAMTLMRGLADDIALMPWLEQHIWPAEQAFVSPQFVKEGSLLACAEMLSGGTTTFNDMYFFPQATIEASLQMGMRASIGLVILEFPTNYADNAHDYMAKGTAVSDQYKSEGLVSFHFAPHAPYTVSDESFSQVITLAEQLNIGIHTHLHETQQEIVDSKAQYGINPISRLHGLGLLSDRTHFAHCVHLTESEVQQITATGSHIVHCPTSNLKLASGIAPVASYLEAGINVALGTDGAASNNRLDMFAEMRLAALLAKGQSGNATAVSAYRAIEMATINGAKALGLDKQVGSIEKTKSADLIAVDLSRLEMSPCYDPVSQLVYVASRENVTHTWVNGNLVYHRPDGNQQGSFDGIEPSELKSITDYWQRMIKQHELESEYVNE